MELLLNELSLNGQFTSVQNFIDNGVKKILHVFKDIDRKDSVSKKYSFYERNVTDKNTLHDILISKESRNIDELRKLKLCWNYFFEAPFWEDEQKHDSTLNYRFNGISISGSSLAESCEREKIIISFFNDDYSDTNILVNKNGQEISVYNLVKDGTYVEFIKDKVSLKEYCNKKYSETKLNFSNIDNKEGFSLISNEDENVFLDGFRKFSELTWQQIIVDDALDYKKFNNKQYFRNIPHQIYKFRISQKYRCFGYVENEIFYVLRFDLTHKLSD